MAYEVFDHLSDAVAILAPDRRLVYLNQSALDIPREELSVILASAKGQSKFELALSSRNWTIFTYAQEGMTILICKAELGLDQRAQRVKTQFSNQIQNGITPPEAAARLLYQELGWKWIAVAHYLDDDRFEVDAFLEDGTLYGPLILDIADTPCEVVREAENFVYLNNVGKRFKSAGELGAQNYAGLVYRSSCGEEIGHIYMLNDSEEVDITATSCILGVLCTELGIFLELESAKQALETSREISLTDPLTTIANRRAFDEDLQSGLDTANKNGDDAVIIFFDLDGFKLLNDAYGHEVGDQALIKTAEKARDLCSKNCKIYRYGGDEFVILSTAPERWYRDLLEDKRSMLEAYLSAQGFRNLGVSIGAATYHEAQSNKENMLRLADKRMYEDKRERKQTSKNEVA
ncbi:MAG: GGDEF domain-containing protein [Cohaesibacter sp.]|nr:GGDEF domain-containing protein [Cohaesibacter sp.]